MKSFDQNQRSVLDDPVFVVGCTTGLFITDPAAGGICPTKEVDAIVDATSGEAGFSRKRR